jgi:DNA mismatch repair ATPase MutS
MVFVALIELGVKGSVFIIQQTWYLGRYLIWGTQKTREQLLEERFQEQIDRENRLINELRSEIKELKESTTQCNGALGTLDTLDTLEEDTELNYDD